MKSMNDNLLNDFEDKYLTNKKRRMIRYLIIGGVSISVIIIIIIIVVVAQNDDKQDKGKKEKEDQENPKNPEKDLEEEEERKEKEEEESEQPISSCPEIKLVNGGKTGSGHATRYWDCCKPSCSWTNNAGSGNEARQCDKNMNILNDLNAKSICENGVSTTCLSQIPFTINGCKDFGFAFGAVPSFYPNTCGKCFLLQFTGEGKYETKPGHVLLKNKRLIIMASNVGSDVENGQFDIMIPGGGEGIYKGCTEILGNDLGKQYGGLLEVCQEEVGYSYDDNTIYVKRKECLINKCNNSFSSKPLAKKGCLFLANFLEAAGNPLHNYQEIECPQVLKDRY